MNKTKIDWADSTWNPVTGCLHGCEYCYARGIANRFGKLENDVDNETFNSKSFLADLYIKHNTPYPYLFKPTFHRYRLDDYKNKKGRTIFVCSMADLFGEWVPDEWIQEVFKACEEAPQHRYLFLTKNPKKFQNTFLTQSLNISKNMWFGFSVTNQESLNNLAMGAKWLPKNTFISIEPLHGQINLTRIEPTGIDAILNFMNGGQFWLGGGDFNGKKIKWVIIGAETGKRKDKIIPEKWWIDEIVEQCKAANVPVFMKESLKNIMGNDFIQEFPWEV